MTIIKSVWGWKLSEGCDAFYINMKQTSLWLLVKTLLGKDTEKLEAEGYL